MERTFQEKNHESNRPLTIWWHRLLWNCCWSLARRYPSTISINDLCRLCLTNISRSNKRKWIHIKKTKSKRYPTDTDYADDLTLIENLHAQAESLLHSLEHAASGIGLYMNADKTEFMYFKQEGAISTLRRKLLKLIGQFLYLGSSISSTESDVNIRFGKMRTTLDWHLII